MSDDRKDLPPVGAPNFLEKVRETMSVYLGNRGNLLDRGVTLRDLSEANIIALKKGFPAGSGGSPVAGPGPAITKPYKPGLTPPPTPTGFAVSAAISNIFIGHDAPLYLQGHGHAKTVVYGATWTAGPLPTFSDAVKITEFSGSVFAHPTNPATTWHLWIKWVSVDGVESAAPAGGTNGLVAVTGQDVSLLLEALTGQITASQLYSALGARIDLIDGPVTLPNSLAQNASFLRSYSNLGSSTFRQNDAPTQRGLDPQTSATVPLRMGDLWLDTNDGNKQYQWDGLAWVYSPDGAIAAVDARVTNVETTKIGYCAIGGVPSDHSTASTCVAAGGIWNVGLPLATAVKQVAITSGGVTAALEQKFIAQALDNGALYAQYTVKIDNAGLISGFGLASTANNAAPSSAFGVRANQFYIAPPSVAQSTAPTVDLYDGYVWLDTSVTPNVTRYRSGASWVLNSPVLPFIVQTTPTMINGVAVPAGVYVADLYVRNGTITNAKIGDLAVDDAKIADLSVSKLTAGSLAVGQYAQSTSFIAGSAGWRINGDGTAEFANAVVRGGVYAAYGAIGGNSIDISGMQSPGYSPGVSGWRLDSSGGFYAKTGTFSGNITGATGAFSGSLLAATGTFSGTLLAATGTFSGGLTAAAIAAVDTINIADNAVTIPVGGTGVGSVPGYPLVLSQPGKIVVMVTATLNSAGPNTSFYVYATCNGVDGPVTAVSASAGFGTAATAVGYFDLPAGTHTVAGRTSNTGSRTLDNTSIFAMGVMR